MRVAFFGAVAFVVACAVQTQLEPPVTCPEVTLNKSPGACDLITTQVCSDNNFYTISCQDDGTCSCSTNNNVTNSFLAADGETSYCASVTDTSQFHSLAMQCIDTQGLGLDLNP
ncbi:MAG TPA: hypothetical protein VGH28_24045 [Polyangiaceae bacterium]|jgi:hypothetical protein